MVTSDRLLQLVAHLRHAANMTDARNELLKYIRKQSGAYIVILFLLDTELQVLVPLSHNGKRSTSSSTQTIKQLMTEPIPLDGLFGSALLTQGFLYIPAIEQEPHALPQERHWGDGQVLLNTIKAGPQIHSEQGVLTLFFAPSTDWLPAVNMEELANDKDLLVCSILLSAYMQREDTSLLLFNPPAEPTHRSRRTNTREKLDQETRALLEESPLPHYTPPPELQYTLSALSDLYEIGLLLDTHTEIDDLYQHILSHVSRIIHAHGACLLLYQPSLHRLIAVAQQGNKQSCAIVIEAIDGNEMERLNMLGPDQIFSSFVKDHQQVLVLTLSCNCILLGVIALAIGEDEVLSDKHRLLLTYMGNVAALLLRNHNVHTQELQTAIEQERNRIARDIHDGAAQQIAHVLHKLEFIQRQLEEQHFLPHTIHTEMERTHDILEAGLTDLREGIVALLPVQLEQQSFTAALQNLLDEYMINDPGMEMSCDTPPALPTALEAPIFRFLQEALTNIRKHAQATHVTIQIQMSPHILVVEVRDNGRGFQVEAQLSREQTAESATRHLGLRAMRERIQEAGGSLEVHSQADEGTILRALFALTHSSPLLTEREHEVLHLIVEGLTNRVIAQTLSISLETVKSHVHHIMQKMQARDRTQAAVLATRHGWL